MGQNEFNQPMRMLAKVRKKAESVLNPFNGGF